MAETTITLSINHVVQLLSCIRLFYDPKDCSPPGLLCP